MIGKEHYHNSAMPHPMAVRYTVDEVVEFPYDENVRYELIRGELFVSHAPHLDHQRTISNLIFRFAKYLDDNPVGEVFPAPGVIFSFEDAVIPDIVYASNETIESRVNQDSQKYAGKFNAAPELVIEVLSFGKRDLSRDRINKLELYGKFGVTEYWIANGLLNQIEVYRLDGESQEHVRTYAVGEAIETPLLPAFELRLSDIFKF